MIILILTSYLSLLAYTLLVSVFFIKDSLVDSFWYGVLWPAYYLETTFTWKRKLLNYLAR